MGARTFVIAGAAALVRCGMLGMAQAAAQASSASVPDCTKQAPAISSPVRSLASMAYDAAAGTAVLFGGNAGSGNLGDTWTWMAPTGPGSTRRTTRTLGPGVDGLRRNHRHRGTVRRVLQQHLQPPQ